MWWLLWIGCAGEPHAPPLLRPACDAPGGGALDDVLEPDGNGEDARLVWSDAESTVLLSVDAVAALDYPDRTGPVDVTFDAAGTVTLRRQCGADPGFGTCRADDALCVAAMSGTVEVRGTLEAHPNDYGGSYCCYGDVDVTLTGVGFPDGGSRVDDVTLTAFVEHLVAD